LRPLIRAQTREDRPLSLGLMRGGLRGQRFAQHVNWRMLCTALLCVAAELGKSNKRQPTSRTLRTELIWSDGPGRTLTSAPGMRSKVGGRERLPPSSCSFIIITIIIMRTTRSCHPSPGGAHAEEGGGRGGVLPQHREVEQRVDGIRPPGRGRGGAARGSKKVWSTACIVEWVYFNEIKDQCCSSNQSPLFSSLTSSGFKFVIPNLVACVCPLTCPQTTATLRGVRGPSGAGARSWAWTSAGWARRWAATSTQRPRCASPTGGGPQRG